MDRSGKASTRVRSLMFGLGVLLALATAITYWPVLTHEFLNIDDSIYVTENRHVQAGLTMASVRWAFASTEEANYWHPLTWLTHMLDVELYGLKPAGHHATSLLLHVANTLVLFWLLAAVGVPSSPRLRRAGSKSSPPENRTPSTEHQSSLLPAFLVAGLFALHPLHVECVAWISERKELLCTFFWLLTLGAYGRYCRLRIADCGLAAGGVDRQSTCWYLLALLCFFLGLMAKPMIVTLPFVLLLLDYWPLGRTAPQGWRRCLSEKLPFFALSLAASVSAFRGQGAGDMLTSLDTLGLGWRVANALTAYVGYLGQTLWPVGLAVYYPHPLESLPLWKPIVAALLLGALSALALWQRKRRPYVLVGWLFYLGTLVPVIGLVQIGSFSMADRYTYLPLLGVFVAVAWWWGEGLETGYWKLVGKKAAAEFWIPVLCVGIVLLVLGVASRRQVGHWRDNQSLFRHQLRVTGGDMVGHNGLGLEALRGGRLDEAVFHFAEAIQFQPGLAGLYVQLGQALAQQGRIEEAIASYEEGLTLQPALADAHMNLGIVLSQQGAREKALAHLRRAVDLKPEEADTHSNLAVLLYRMGQPAEAFQELHVAVALDPLNAAAHNNLGRMLLMAGKPVEALSELREAVRLDPSYMEARENLRQAEVAVGPGL